MSRLEQLARAATAEAARRHLRNFLPLLVRDYEPSRHLELVCSYLEALVAGEITRLMVLTPPRHGKTLHVAQALPAWFLGRNPTKQVILASWGAELAEENSRRARGFITDPAYPFPLVLASDSSAVQRWHLAQGGGLVAAGVGGGITGFGADLLIIDDPLKDRDAADSEGQRQRIDAWYREVALTRLMPGGCVLLAMTRWHEDDLAGRILAGPDAEPWTVLSLPALAEENDAVGREPGEALWPARYPVEVLRARERVMRGRAFASLYQQQPSPAEGTIIRQAWLQHRYPTAPQQLQVVQAVDTAFKTGVGADYSVIATWACNEQHYFLLDLWRERVEFPQLVRQIEQQAALHQPDAILVEDAASGQSAIQHLRQQTRLPIVPVRPEGSKESRLEAVSPLFEAGKVLLPKSAPWLDGWIDEHLRFPNGRHDDQVDTTSLALNRLRYPSGPRLTFFRSHRGRRGIL